MNTAGPEKRKFKKLRVSLTNLCNLACNYCVPPDGLAKSPPTALNTISNDKDLQFIGQLKLTITELGEIICKLHSILNFSQIRLTGGEPLLHPDLGKLIQLLSESNINNIGLTTNGFLLPIQAQRLKDAGLKSVNISIDSLNEKSFQTITNKPYLPKVLLGINKAIEVGLEVKLNAVIMNGLNDDQILPLIEYANSRKVLLRFIELMKMGHLYESDTSLFYPAQRILKKIETKYEINPLSRPAHSTANYWLLENGQKFGIIANEGFPFCSDCDRLRIDEYGRIYGCISSNKGFSVAPYAFDEEKLKEQLSFALKTKQPKKFKGSVRSMITVGG